MGVSDAWRADQLLMQKPNRKLLNLNGNFIGVLPMTDFIQVSTTTDKREDAEKISQAIVSQRLAACVQIAGPVTSHYWWKGEIEKAEEWLLLIKTNRDLYHQLEEEIRRIHPYDVPEIIAVPVIEGSRDYLDWIKSETDKD
jgi:periplasmic divalent cation tolerance protein